MLMDFLRNEMETISISIFEYLGKSMFIEIIFAGLRLAQDFVSHSVDGYILMLV